MKYIVKNLRELAELFRMRAQHVSERLDRQNLSGLTRLEQRERLILQTEVNVTIALASIVLDTVLEDVPVAEEYRLEYEGAVIYAGTQIWASIQRHAGDPRWEYSIEPGERLT